MKSSGDWESPFHDTEVMRIEEAEREHAPRAFRVPRWTATCPGCGRGVSPRMLEVPHWNPESKPICTACRKRAAKWHETPAQRAARIKAREAREAAGVKPHVPGGFDEV